MVHYLILFVNPCRSQKPLFGIDNRKCSPYVHEKPTVYPNFQEASAMTHEMPVVEIIGKDTFQWLSKEFNKKTRLKDIPDEILNSIASVDITIRNYAKDRNSIISIALITFAYKMTNAIQKAHLGPKDILLLKVLAKKEKRRREDRSESQHTILNAPVYELITGEVGERIRKMRTMNSPV